MKINQCIKNDMQFDFKEKWLRLKTELLEALKGCFSDLGLEGNKLNQEESKSKEWRQISSEISQLLLSSMC